MTRFKLLLYVPIIGFLYLLILIEQKADIPVYRFRKSAFFQCLCIWLIIIYFL